MITWRKESDGQISISYAKGFITVFEELNLVFENVNAMMIGFTKVLSHIVS